MSAHLECGSVGKFDCEHDAYVMDTFGDSGDPGEGHVDSPSAWFGVLQLDPVSEAEHVEHYGTRWVIAREFSDGRVIVETFATEEMQLERAEVLRAADAEWNPYALDL